MTKQERLAKLAEINASGLSKHQKVLDIKKFIEEEQKAEEQAKADQEKQAIAKEKETERNAVKKVELAGDNMVTIRGPKGEKGDKPSDEELISLIKPLIPEPIVGPEGPEGKASTIPGPIGPKGDSIVGPQGATGLTGPRGPISTTPGPAGKDGSPDTAIEIKNKLESLSKNDRLSIFAIKGLEDFQTQIVNHAVTQARGLLYAGLLENQGSVASGSGTVTSISIVAANGITGTVATASTTPAITLTLGAITPTTVNKVTITTPATGSTLTITDGKTLTANNSITLAGTDSTTMTFPSTTATIARTDAGQTFTGIQIFSSTPLLLNNSISFTGDVSGTASLTGPHSGGGTITLPAGTHTLLAADGSGTGLSGIPYALTGTANQVNLSASTGNITFSLPQSIATSSTPQFAKIGIGAAADATRLLYVTGNVSGGVVTLERTNASTNAAVGTVIIKGTSTGDMVDGFGSAFQFAIQDTAAVENLIANIQGVRDGADNNGKLVFATATAGTANIGMTISSSQVTTLVNSSHIGAVLDISALATSDKTFTFPNQSGTFATVTSGSGAPGSTPTAVGQVYVDTTGLKVYASTGIASSGDWKILN